MGRKWGVMLPFVLCAVAWGQDLPPEMPKHMVSVAEGADLARRRTVTLLVGSRRVADPENPEILDKLRKKVVDGLAKSPYTLVAQPGSAELVLELVDEPHQRWGIFHYQVNPYIYLLLRDRSTGRALYCAYRRAGFVHSATTELMEELVKQASGKGPPPDGEIRVCARAALRPW